MVRQRDIYRCFGFRVISSPFAIVRLTLFMFYVFFFANLIQYLPHFLICLVVCIAHLSFGIHRYQTICTQSTFLQRHHEVLPGIRIQCLDSRVCSTRSIHFGVSVCV